MIPMLRQRLFSRFRIELKMYHNEQTGARTTAFRAARTVIINPAKSSPTPASYEIAY
jgi:hypothetical protein